MGRGDSSEFSAEEVFAKLHNLPQAIADDIVHAKGDVGAVKGTIEAALRDLDPTGIPGHLQPLVYLLLSGLPRSHLKRIQLTTYPPSGSRIDPPGTIKQGSLEQGLLKWDAHLGRKFSKAYGGDETKWMTDSRETIREALVKRNKAILSQKKRDQQKSEAAARKRPAAATPGSKDRASHQGKHGQGKRICYCIAHSSFSGTIRYTQNLATSCESLECDPARQRGPGDGRAGERKGRVSAKSQRGAAHRTSPQRERNA